jgi:hypothetical protein
MAARVARNPRMRLTALAECYGRTHVASQADGIQEAKQRDLACFLHFYTQRSGHEQARAWDMSVADAFVKERARGNVPRPSNTGAPPPKHLAPATIARTYAAVRHFAPWVHQHISPFPLECPTDGVKLPEAEDSTWKGLS